MSLKSFIINNSNKFFAKTHDYKELKAWMEKVSDKLFLAALGSLVLMGISCNIEFFIFKTNPFLNFSGFWFFLILGIFLFVLSVTFYYYKDFVKNVGPTILKKSKILIWKEIYPNQKDIDVWVQTFIPSSESSTLDLMSQIKAGEDYSYKDYKEDDKYDFDFLYHAFNSDLFDKTIRNSVSILLEKNVSGKVVTTPLEFVGKLKPNDHFEAEYIINPDEIIENLKEFMRFDKLYFGEVREEILSNVFLSISKLEIGRQYIDCSFFGYKFEDVAYIAKITIDAKSNEELQNSKIVEIVKNLAEKERESNQALKEAKDDMSEFVKMLF